MEIRRLDVYNDFIEWFASPSFKKYELGIETQEEFAKHFRVSKDTLSLWKQRPDFQQKVNRALKQWAHGRTSSVLDAIYKGALEGNPGSQKLWMDYFEDEKKIGKQKIVPIISEEDIRYMMEDMPEELQEKYTIFLADLGADMAALYREDKAMIERSVRHYKEEKELIEAFRKQKDEENRDPGEYL